MERTTVYLHAVTPLHVGTGQALDVIDLPIQRERGTGLPVVAGSAVKGVIRAECEAGGAAPFVTSAFGKSGDESDAGAGAVTFGDARLLLLPVRSVRLLFAWVTCPYVLQRYVADRAAGKADVSVERAALKAIAQAGSVAVCSSSKLLSKDKAFVEDADLAARAQDQVAKLAVTLATRCLRPDLAPLLADRLLVVSDTQFGVFSRQCMEITARVKLDSEKKTVVRGGLWYEEALPAEAVLYAGVTAERTRARSHGHPDLDGAQHLAELRRIASAQFGGKASVGRGLCSLSWE